MQRFTQISQMPPIFVYYIGQIYDLVYMQSL